MKVLLAGASGVLGRPTTQQLVAAGHEVIGLARSDAAAEVIRSLGGTPVRGDVLDADSTRVAAVGVDAVVNLSAAVPLGTDVKQATKENDRVRLEGTRNLLAAAEAGGAKVYVHESLLYVYGDWGRTWVTEGTESTGTLAPSALEAEGLVQASGLPWVILRYGSVYGREAWHTQLMVSQLKKRLLPIVGDGANYWSLVHAEDAGRATALAVEDAADSSIYNVCDDEPVTMADLFTYLAAQLGVQPPMKVPALVARMAIGGDATDLLASSIRMSNRAIKQDLDFEPRYPTYREGLAEVLSAPVPEAVVE
ncbi:MAG: NAD(P)-dependent oxidoreductase [Chloroflexota bacterium]|nr:NAD(P)-dependent oxidoreductase [Chloroflexota bacterium]